MSPIQRLRQLIAATHAAGVALGRRLRGLELLNRRRRRALAVLEARSTLPPKEANPKPITMFDSTDLTQYPDELEAFATYIDGKKDFQHFDALHAKHPRAKFITLAVFAWTDAGTGLDVEPGNAKPSEAPGWVRKRHSKGIRRPWLYADRSEMVEVMAALGADGISRDQYRLWVADPTGKPHIPDGFDACQYDWSALGRNLDASLVKAGLL